MKSKKIFFATIIGNVLDHYDTALLMFMGSVIAPLFFACDDSRVALIKYYGMLSISVISRPIGSLVFSKIANQYKPSISLFITLLGTAFATMLIGFLPTYQEAGLIASVGFCVVRFFQTFFGSGEHVVGVMFLLDNAPDEKRANMASFFNSSTMIGISLASFASYLVASSNNPQLYWRIPFYLGILTAIMGVIFRLITLNEPLYNKARNIDEKKLEGFVKIIQNNYKTILVIAILYIFTMLTYYIPFTFLNEYIPLIHKNINRAQMLKYNSLFLYYDLALILLIGVYFKNIQYKKLIIYATFSLLIFALPAFLLLQIGSSFIIESVRLIVITIGVVFLSSFQAYIYDICDSSERYIVHGAGLLIGQDFIGRLTVTICFFLWYYFDSPLAPSIYVILISGLSFFSIIFYKPKLSK